MKFGNTEWFRSPPSSVARNVRRSEYGKPAVVGTGTGTKTIKDGSKVIVDGEKGVVVISGKSGKGQSFLHHSLSVVM